MSKDTSQLVEAPVGLSGASRSVERLKRHQQLKEKFLTHLARNGNISESARMAGVERSTLYGWRESDAAFAADWESALEDAVDALEAEARRRAVDGYDEPVLSGGRVVCDEAGIPLMRRKYSDGLLSFLLRAHRPSRFRERDQEDKAGMITITITPDDSVL